MTTEQQNTNWACLPKETRTAIRLDYNNVLHNPRLDKFDSVYLAAFEDIFGKHNIASDTEPEEMLTIPRKDVQEFYAEICKTIDRSQDTNVRICSQGKIIALKSLFGDKCLPDKEVLTAENVNESVIAQPKTLNVGDKVKIILCTHPEYRDKVGIITSIDSCGNPYVKVDGLGTLFHAPYALEPYTEPYNVSANEAKEEAKDNMKMEEKETKNYPPYLDYPIVTKGEKELNRDQDFKMGDDVYMGTELLGKFICYSYSQNYKEVMVEVLVDSGKDREASQGGWFAKYVSKRPQKSEWWRAKKGENYWVVDIELSPTWLEEKNNVYDKVRYYNGNYFRTEEEATQAAEVIKAALAKFHEKSTKQ